MRAVNESRAAAERHDGLSGRAAKLQDLGEFGRTRRPHYGAGFVGVLPRPTRCAATDILTGQYAALADNFRNLPQ